MFCVCNGWYFNFLCLSLIFCPSWHCKNKIILIGFWYCYYMYIVSQFQSVRICQNYFNCWQAIALNFLNSLFCFFFFKWDLGVDAVSSFLIAVLCIVYFSSSIFGVFNTLLIFVVVFFFFYGQWLIPQECIVYSLKTRNWKPIRQQYKPFYCQRNL